MKRWEELNADAKVARNTRQARVAESAITREWIDSEFAPTQLDGPSRQQAVKNIHAMSFKEFRSYLEALRQKRPAFKQFLLEKGEKDTRIGNKSLFDLSQKDSDYHAEFIAEETSKAINTVDSRWIETVPHKTGGLLYSHPSPLQTYLTTKPQPGRILSDTIPAPRRPIDYIAGFAGMTHVVSKNKSTGVEKMAWDEDADSNRGVAQFRMIHPKLKAAPRVVGKNRHGLKGVKLRLESRVIPSGPEVGRSNSHMPGSVDYVAANPAPAGIKGRKHAPPMDFNNLRSGRQRAKQFTPQHKNESANSTIINVLQRIISTKPPGSNSDSL